MRADRKMRATGPDGSVAPSATTTYQIVIPPNLAALGGLRFESQSPSGKAGRLTGLALGSERVGNAIGLRESPNANPVRWAIVLEVEKFEDGHVRLTVRED